MDESNAPSSLPVNPFGASGAAGSYMPPTVANTTIPKTIGILNIVFGAILCLCGMVAAVQSLAWLALAPSLDQFMQEAQTTLQDQTAESEQEVQDLILQEEAAENEDERAVLKAEREAAERELDQRKSAPQAFPGMVNPFAMARDPRLLVFGIVNESAGLILNVLLVISGVGLIKLKEWGRKLSLWAAGLKLGRLVVVAVYQVVVIAPLMAGQMKGMMDAMAQQAGPGAPPMGGFAAMMAGMQSAAAVAGFIFASIYPIVVLVCLTRQSARAACQGTIVSA